MQMAQVVKIGVVVLAAILYLPDALAAQELRLASATPVVGPVVGPVVVQAGITRAATVPTELNLQEGASRDRNVLMMLVGGATMVAGTFIDGDAGTVFIVGGAVIALAGLFRFMQ